MLMLVMLGALFTLKFYSETKRTEIALQVRALVDESRYDESATWAIRRSNYLEALKILNEARADKVKMDDLVDEAVEGLGEDPVYAAAVGVGLLRNLDLAEEYHLFNETNEERYEHGGDLKIGKGANRGEVIILDTVVPYRFSPELEMSFANLMFKPKSMAEKHPNRFGEGSQAVLTACRQANILTDASFNRAIRAMESGGVR